MINEDIPVKVDSLTSAFVIEELTLWNPYWDVDGSDKLCMKAQAKKVLEEAAEVYAAWQDWECEGEEDCGRLNYKKEYILEEVADVIQAAMNMAYCLGYTHCDIEEAMKACQRKNKKRGRC